MRRRPWNKNPDPPKQECLKLYLEEFVPLYKLAKRYRLKITRLRAILRSRGVEIRGRHDYVGPMSFLWEGGRTRDKSGYVLVHRPDHPDANRCGYVREHRLVMEEILGRRLARHEVVDHKNGVKDDNRPENLRLFQSNADHLRDNLTGKRPKWTEDGKRRIREGVQRSAAVRRAKKLAKRSATPRPPQEVDVPVSSATPARSTAAPGKGRRNPSRTVGSPASAPVGPSPGPGC